MAMAVEVDTKGENTDEHQGYWGLSGNISARVFRVTCPSQA